jgi:hypothetical protein
LRAIAHAFDRSDFDRVERTSSLRAHSPSLSGARTRARLSPGEAHPAMRVPPRSERRCNWHRGW